jgi:hypothetical protein
MIERVYYAREHAQQFSHELYLYKNKSFVGFYWIIVNCAQGQERCAFSQKHNLSIQNFLRRTFAFVVDSLNN